jgi:hypothetical protein
VVIFLPGTIGRDFKRAPVSAAETKSEQKRQTITNLTMKRSKPTTKALSERGKLDGWERGWQKDWSKAGLPGCELPAMGTTFRAGMRQRGRFVMQQGVFAKEAIGFGHVTDSPREAVDMIQFGLYPEVRRRLKPR